MFRETLRAYAEGQLMLIEIGRRALAKTGAKNVTEEQADLRGHQAAQRLGRQERRRRRRPALRRLLQERAAAAESGSLSVARLQSAADGGSPDPSPGLGRVAAGQPEVQLTLLVTSPRVAPGLLSWSAWQAVAAAPRRLASAADAPLARAVAGAGHPVDVLPEASVPALLDLARARRRGLAGRRRRGGGAPRRARGGDRRTAASVEVEVLHGVVRRAGRPAAGPGDGDGPAAHRVPVGPRADPPVAGEVPAGGDLRDPRGDRGCREDPTTRTCARSSATCCCRSTSTPGWPPRTPDGFTIDDVAAGIVDKLVHRHPHVFAGLDVADADEVERNWEALKAAEKGRASVLDGIPPALPALALADKMLGRAARRPASPPGPGADVAGRPAARPRRRGPGRRARRRSRRCATRSAGWPTPSAPPSRASRAAAASGRRPRRAPSRAPARPTRGRPCRTGACRAAPSPPASAR